MVQLASLTHWRCRAGFALKWLIKFCCLTADDIMTYHHITSPWSHHLLRHPPRQVIAETLPYLERLTVRLDKHAPVAPGSVKFAIAAVDSLPKLRQVSFWDMTYYTSPEFETQLLSFARSCAASGRNLRIVYDGDAGWGYSSTRDKLKAWNRELRRVAAPGCTVEIVN